MAAKKKSAPAKSKSKAKPPVKQVAQKAAAKPAKATAKTAAAKPAKAAAKPAKAAAKPAAKPAKTEAKSAKPAKAAKPAAKSAKAAKPAPKPTAPAKLAKPAKAAKAETSESQTLEAGGKAPAFELADETGAAISSSSLSGRPYLLYFYPKDDTPGCTKEACDIRDNFARFGKHGLRVLGVSPDSSQSHAKFGKKYGLPFTLLSDADKTLANAYGVWGLKNNYGKEYMGIVRSSFLVGADGLVKKTYRGVKVPGHVDAVLEDASSLL